MGNYFSMFEDTDSTTPICPLCNKNTTKGMYIYNNMECFQCKKRSEEYYHPDCWTNYMDTYMLKKGYFVCYKCTNNNTRISKMDADMKDDECENTEL